MPKTKTPTIPDPDSPTSLFVSMTGKIHLLGKESWGDNPGCTSQFTKGSRVAGTRGQVDCLKCVEMLIPPETGE